MTLSESDILILGAGPAGCAAAITAIAKGCRVTLLERKTQPRQQPGETLHPGIESILRQLGVWEALVQQGFHRHQGIWREDAQGARTFTPYGRDESGNWCGLQVDRVVLNGLLRDRVKRLGGAIVDTDELEFVRSSDGMSVAAEGRVYRAGVILDATGRHAWLAQRLGLARERREPAQRLWFGWKRDGMPHLRGQPLFSERPDGWDWLCPLADKRCSWVKLRRTVTDGGIDYTNGVHPDCAGEGYILLGDAAFLLDPSYANGVLRALMTGIYAASLCADVRAKRISWDCAQQQYRRWIRQFFDVSIEANTKPRAVEANQPESAFMSVSSDPIWLPAPA